MKEGGEFHDEDERNGRKAHDDDLGPWRKIIPMAHLNESLSSEKVTISFKKFMVVIRTALNFLDKLRLLIASRECLEQSSAGRAD